MACQTIDMTPLFSKDPNDFFYGETIEQRTVPVLSLQFRDKKIVFYFIGNDKGFIFKGSHYRSCTGTVEFDLKKHGVERCWEQLLEPKLLTSFVGMLVDDLIPAREKFNKDCVRIQAFVRGFLARKAYRELLKRIEEDYKKAVRLQRLCSSRSEDDFKAKCRAAAEGDLLSLREKYAFVLTFNRTFTF